jgi:hypothetical protein
MVSHLPSNLLDTINEVVDANQPTTTTTASPDSSVPSIDEHVCHSTNNDILPLWFWAGQTSAAIINLNIGNTESLVKPPPTPDQAAVTIQLAIRRYQFKQYAARQLYQFKQFVAKYEYEIFCQQSCINIDVSSDYVTSNTPTIAERPINDVSSDYVTTNTPTLSSRLGTSLGILCSTVKNEVHYKFWK